MKRSFWVMISQTLIGVGCVAVTIAVIDGPAWVLFIAIPLYIVGLIIGQWC